MKAEDLVKLVQENFRPDEEIYVSEYFEGYPVPHIGVVEVQDWQVVDGKFKLVGTVKALGYSREEDDDAPDLLRRSDDPPSDRTP